MIRFQLVIFCCFYTTVSSFLENRLKHFETLNHDSLRHHITRRDIYSQLPDERKVDYDALGRHFRLVLHRSSSLLSSDFRVVAINGDEERVVDVTPSMYHGYLEDEPYTSSVSAYWEDDQTLSASIKTKSDVFIVEPSWRHLPNATNVTMITYKASDVDMEKDLGRNFCGYIRVNTSKEEENDDENEESEMDDEQITGQSDARVRRQASSCVKDEKTTCSLLLVADYRFYQSMSLQSLSKTTGYMINQIDKIDNIYRQQDFGSCGYGLGFEIREIRIHETPTAVPGNMLHYNMDKDDWDTTQLLEVFSTDSLFERFCLAHLFTHTAFDNGLLGLSYIASPRSYSVGGICSPSYTKAGTKMFLNTGWSSSLNRYNRKLLTQEALLITAHEFGHSWGSEHDPDTTECSPSASVGGKYIMFTHYVSGIDSNNKMFSPCSKRSIGAVLKAKAAVCFSKIAGGFCGNSFVEHPEECDEGPEGSSPGTRCCTDKCKFKPNARCSDLNQECCENCKFASKTKVCYSEQDALCEGQATCSGTSGQCPDAPPKPDGSSCLERGHCRGKICLSFCEYNGKISCICDKVETSCKWCCKDNDTSECRPFTGGNTSVSSFDHPDGMPCIQGFCERGACLKQVHDTIERLWNIEDVTLDKVCNEETDEKYSIHWPRTKEGTGSIRPCPKNNTGSCSRKCDANARWSPPNCNGCFDKEFKELLDKVTKVEDAALKNQTVVNAIASQLSVVTNKSEGLSPGNLNASVMMINRLAVLRSNSTVTASASEIRSIVQAASNVLQTNNSGAWQELEDVNKNVATSILFSLDVYGRSLSTLNISEHIIEEEASLVLEAWSFEKSNLPLQIEFPNRSLWGENSGDGISISMDALTSGISSESQSSLNMWGSYYRTASDYLPGNKDSNVSTRVLAFSIAGLKPNETLKRPVLITLRHDQEKRTIFRRTCSFWNFDRGEWDSIGCSVTSTNSTHTICSCDHLTNFAVLMSLKPSQDKMLSLISVIGCSISVAALILTIIVYALTWKQAKSAQATVLLNLCVALIIAYIVFLAGADKFDRDVYSEVGCTTVAVLLHYFFLAAFFIMLIEGVELVLYIIFVFHVRRTRETIMLLVAAWVLPLIVVGASLGSTKLEGYGHQTACWLSVENYLIWAFIGPVLFIITANFIILIVVLRWMSKKKAVLANNTKKRDEIRATLWNLSVTCPVLGLGWLFGFLTLVFDHSLFQYLFIIANSLQGLLIFIFHALFHNKKVNEKIASVYSNYICRCRKSDVSASTQTTSSQGQPTKKTDKKGSTSKAGKGKQGNLQSTGTNLTSFADSETMESSH